MALVEEKNRTMKQQGKFRNEPMYAWNFLYNNGRILDCCRKSISTNGVGRLAIHLKNKITTSHDLQK